MSGLTVLHGARTVQLTKGYSSLIDEADWPEVSKIRWSAYLGPRGHRYAVGTFNGEFGSLHRFLMNPEADQDVDHRSGDGLDNMRGNLRCCTRAENIRNCRKTYGVSRFKGVDYHKKNGAWRARIMAPNGKRKQLGHFATERDAALAYDRAAVELFGQYACTNAHIFNDVQANPSVGTVKDVVAGLNCLMRYGPGRVRVGSNMIFAGPDSNEEGFAESDVQTLERHGWLFDETDCRWRRPV